MKKAVSLFLIAALCLSGCAIGRERFVEPVTFYYPREHSTTADYDTFFSEGAIGSETREASGHRQDLNYLLTIYLQGPLDPELSSPFPSGCRPVKISREERTLTVALNPVITQLNDMELTIACACLARTCMGLSEVDTVHVESRDQDQNILFSRSFTKDNLLLEDTYTQPQETTEPT